MARPTRLRPKQAAAAARVRAAERGLGALVAVRVAHVLYRRWEAMTPADRDRLSKLAHDVKERALDLRGMVDRSAAERDLDRASRRLASAMADSAEADPAVGDEELAALRSDLERELARVAHAGERRAA